MEVLRFQANIPEEVALKFDDGKAVEGRYGDQVLYTLTDDRVMYLPPIAAKRITDLRIRKNELMSVCKQEVARGQKRSIEWVVKRVDPAPETAAVQPAAASNHQASHAVRHDNTANSSTEDNRLEHQLRASIAMVQEQKNGHLAPAPQDRPHTQLESALITAIAAASAAEKYAAEIHFAVHFEHEDIRAMAISTLIGMQQNGGQR
ncbi:MAG TPA: hypothetical protein VNH41_10350 [Steroidobacteraceae bacterium]|nr:hypothetical protein [Steroidobacteraceae bacterium]